MENKDVFYKNNWNLKGLDETIGEYEPSYWKNKTQWIDSTPNIKLNLLPDYRLSDEEYYRQQKNIREVMELNMVMYGKW